MILLKFMFIAVLVIVTHVRVWAACDDTNLVIDCAMSDSSALASQSFPAEVLYLQRVVTVRYWGMDGKRHQGQIVVYRDVVDDVRAIFNELDSAQFPIQSVVPIVRYRWDDDASIARNNTSGFNYRTVDGSQRLSLHAYGLAIDLNPYLNPYVRIGRRQVRPYNPATPGTIVHGDIVHKAFTSRGWQWGGDWKNDKDYQHFDKRGLLNTTP